MLIPFENVQLEYKLTVDKDSLCREIVALANTAGGKIIIGIADDRTVVGTGKLTADDVANMARDGCVPPLAPEISQKNHDGKKIITVTVKPNGDIPYRTNRGAYHIRVGATVRTASLPELIGLIVKGPHGNTIRFKARMPQLRDRIYESMLANAGFDQALTGIAALSHLGLKADESVKVEVVDMIGGLLHIPCSNDELIRRMLMLLAILASNDLAVSLWVTPPSRAFFERVIGIMKRELDHVTINSKVTNRTKHVLDALYIVGLGCIWSSYIDQLRMVIEVVNSNCGRDNKLTKLCQDTTAMLVKCAAEEPTNPARRLGMMAEPFVNQRNGSGWFSWFRDLF